MRCWTCHSERSEEGTVRPTRPLAEATLSSAEGLRVTGAAGLRIVIDAPAFKLGWG